MSDVSFDTILARSCVGALKVLGVTEGAGPQGWFSVFLLLGG